MSFTDIFIRRPVLATVVSLLILLIGLAAAFNLPVRQFPRTSNTTITITTTYPGANADLIKGFITTPIQQAVASAEGIDTLTSSSQQNTTGHPQPAPRCRPRPRGGRRAVEGQPGQERAAGRGQGPDRHQADRRALRADVSVVQQQGHDRLADHRLPRRASCSRSLQTIDGVANAQILGGQTFAMRIWLDPDKMAALGVTPLDVRNALATNNFTTAAGQVKGDFVQTTINAQTSLDSPDEFGKLVVATRGDALIRLGDIADIELGAENADSVLRLRRPEGGVHRHLRDADANPLTVIGNVRKAFPDIQRQLPPGIEAAIAYDATKFINASIEEVQTTLLEAAADRRRRHLPVPRQPALDAHPDRHHPAVADRRDVRAAGARLLASTC